MPGLRRERNMGIETEGTVAPEVRMIQLGPSITQWANMTEDHSAEPAGRYLRVRTDGGSIPLKFQYNYWRLDNGNVLYWYVPLPQGKDLVLWLRDLLKNEGISPIDLYVED